jgi:hypothetical protein
MMEMLERNEEEVDNEQTKGPRIKKRINGIIGLQRRRLFLSFLSFLSFEPLAGDG